MHLVQAELLVQISAPELLWSWCERMAGVLLRCLSCTDCCLHVHCLWIPLKSRLGSSGRRTEQSCRKMPEVFFREGPWSCWSAAWGRSGNKITGQAAFFPSLLFPGVASCFSGILSPVEVMINRRPAARPASLVDGGGKLSFLGNVALCCVLTSRQGRVRSAESCGQAAQGVGGKRNRILPPSPRKPEEMGNAGRQLERSRVLCGGCVARGVGLVWEGSPQGEVMCCTEENS